MRGLAMVNEDGRVVVTDRGIQVLAERADRLVGCVKGSEEEKELERISDVLDARSMT